LWNDGAEKDKKVKLRDRSALSWFSEAEGRPQEMAKQRHSEEGILRSLRETKSGDRVVVEVCRTHGIQVSGDGGHANGKMKYHLSGKGHVIAITQE
jgi:hypothetical protein